MSEILFIVGSLRKHSFNRALALDAKKIIGNRAQVKFLEYGDIPFMNQDLEANPPESIKRVKQEVIDAPAIWIFTPEYNGMIPGVLKNLLDWLSRLIIPGNFASGTPLKGKPVTFSGIGGRNATKGSRGQLDILLHTLGMKVMSEPSCGFVLNPKAFTTDEFEISVEQEKELEAQVNAFLAFIKENQL